MSTKLKIWTAWNQEPRDRIIWEERRLIIKPPVIVLRVYMELSDEQGRKGITIIWSMKAPINENEPEMRRQLLASTRFERYAHIAVMTSKVDTQNITSIEVDDETGLLKWLCPGQDLKDFFNQQNKINAEPLRLPS